MTETEVVTRRRAFTIKRRAPTFANMTSAASGAASDRALAVAARAPMPVLGDLSAAAKGKKAQEKTKLSFGDVMKKASQRAFRGGAAGFAAGVVQVRRPTSRSSSASRRSVRVDVAWHVGVIRARRLIVRTIRRNHRPSRSIPMRSNPKPSSSSARRVASSLLFFSPGRHVHVDAHDDELPVRKRRHAHQRAPDVVQRRRDPSLLPRRLVRDHSEPAVAIRRHRGEHWHPRRARRAVPEHAHRAADRVRVLGRRLVAHRAHAGGHVQGASHLTRTGPRTTASAR